MLLIYQKYIIRHIALFISISFIVATTIIFLEEISRLTYILDKAISIWHLLCITFLYIPNFLLEIFPILVWFGTSYAYLTLKRSFELSVLSMSGISDFRLAITSFYIIIPLILMHYLLYWYISPLSYGTAKSIFYSKRDNIIGSISPNTLNIIGSNKFIYFQKNKNKKLSNIIFVDNASTKSTSKYVVIAKEALLDKNYDLHFYHGKQFCHDKNFSQEMTFNHLILSSYKKLYYTYVDKKERIQKYYIGDLINIVTNSKNNIPYIAELVQRVIWPLYSLILALLSIKMLLIFKKHEILYSSFIIIPFIMLHFIFYNISINHYYGSWLCVSLCLFLMVSSIIFLNYKNE